MSTQRCRIRLAMVALGVASIAVAGCGGANERRASTNAGAVPNAPAAPANAPSAPSVPSTPPTTPDHPIDPNCGPLANFQLWNYSAGSLDAKKFPDQKDGVIKGLEEAAAKAAAAIPELAPSLKVVVAQDKAVLNGQGNYTPAAGEPSVEDAGKKLFAWSKDKC